MRIIARKTLKSFWIRHSDAEQGLKSWYSEAVKASWRNPADVKREYVKSSIIADNRVIFNICGNKYRLIVKMNYERLWVFIRFVGTHKEYNEINAETI